MIPECIVFYDGDCAFCHKAIRFILQHDVGKQFYIAPLQGSHAGLLLPESLLQIDSLVLFYHGNIYIRSKAVFEITRLLKFPWNLLSIFRKLPVSWTDMLYNFVAKHRHKLLSHTICHLPHPTWKNRCLP